MRDYAIFTWYDLQYLHVVRALKSRRIRHVMLAHGPAFARGFILVRFHPALHVDQDVAEGLHTVVQQHGCHLRHLRADHHRLEDVLGGMYAARHGHIGLDVDIQHRHPAQPQARWCRC